MLRFERYVCRGCTAAAAVPVDDDMAQLVSFTTCPDCAGTNFDVTDSPDQPKLLAMMHALNDEPRTATELATRTGVDHATVCRLLFQLKQAGLVARETPTGLWHWQGFGVAGTVKAVRRANKGA